MLPDSKKYAFDVIIEAGQSNAEGYGRGPVTEEYIPDADLLYLTHDFSLKEAKENEAFDFDFNTENPKLHIEVADEHRDGDEKIGDLSLTFSREYKKNGYLKEGRKLLVVRAAVGGSGFKKRRWGLSDPLYLRLIAMVEFALSLNPENKLVAFLWHQGEHDAFEKNRPDIFESQLRALIADVKCRFSVPDIPFVSGDFVSHWKNENIEDCLPIVEKIKCVTKDVGGVFVETSDLLSNDQMTGNGDPIHFCRESLHILGVRYFEAFERISNKKQ